ncbi:putative bifunctional diguanylate cyclase/phosphodiesterase [Paractinoplanes lichenicola]|uniref:Bifunctional diguanylate cyclase/phosphodiesterase n=1 Tax=Paractinoplanes lichenicola TaxID=2802976 RepID=A0ABS1VRY0_9ACTN|nr:bifunctional diguanylate cyclase/phosphodiesterase [Actinoplanes lichenicola]MBL7257450.1 bifunctional diguanylate cyclase/phosphodiesterase [Actinoplanes lichenicola]
MRVIFALRVGAVVLTVLFAGLQPLGDVPLWAEAVTLNGVYLCATALVVARAVLVRPHRVVWALIGAGLCFYTAATAYTWSEQWQGDVLPYPSLADAGWLSFYPLAYCGILGFFGRRWPSRRLLLDGAIAGLGGAALFSVLVVDILLGSLSGSGLAQFVTLCYPLGDSLLLGTLVCQVTAGQAAARRNPVLIAGVAMFVVADTSYVVLSAKGLYSSGGAANLLYLTGLTLIGISAWHRLDTPTAVRASPARMAVPISFAVGALVLLTVATRVRLSSLTVALAGATLVLVVGRVFEALRELESIGRERHSEARRDPLTGLANRRAVHEHIDQLLSRTRPRPIAMLLLDLDKFKEVNDSYGHPAGDQLLQLASGRLKQVTRQSDLLGRLGGDEFVLVMSGESLTADEADRLAARIRAELLKPFLIDGVQITIDVSIGIAHDGGEDADSLFQHADIAMYNAKRAGGGHVVYRRNDDQESRLRLELTTALRRDVATAAMILHYQPKLDLRTGVIRGFEALVRWQHPERGLLMPDVFLPIAEQNGLMSALTQNVLSQAIRECARWHAEGNRVSVAVNASATDLRFECFPQQILDLLDAHDLPAKALTVEITETMMLTDWATTDRVLDRLTSMGVRVSIDDYGTHHSTLSYLRRLHTAAELKLDRSFIADMLTAPRSAAIVRSTIDLAHDLGITVVAEGVEDAETLDTLREWGCDQAQGYHIGRPAPIAALKPQFAKS